MDRPRFDAETAAAAEIARAAGAIVLGWHQRRDALRVRLKGPTDPVTAADLEAEQFIREQLRRRFPGDAVVAEEGGGSTGAARCWYVDPLDGTVDFANGLPGFTVSLALDDGTLRGGAVYAPLTGELFVAQRGAGAWLDRGGDVTRLAVSGVERLRDAVAATGVPYETWKTGRNTAEVGAMMRAARAVRILGGAALHLAFVAAGRLDVFWEPALNSYDVAAGLLLVREAGGTVTGFGGEPFVLTGGQMLATNGRLHTQSIDVLRAASPGT